MKEQYQYLYTKKKIFKKLLMMSEHRKEKLNNNSWLLQYNKYQNLQIQKLLDLRHRFSTYSIKTLN
jgi:hypothetical protein